MHYKVVYKGISIKWPDSFIIWWI